ncbi:MAG: YdeI/OmpD-associated family protein [Verrucomicrobiota bacterium]
MIEDLEKVEVRSAAEVWSWFKTHHAQPDSIWLVTYKKAVPKRYVSNSEVVDACIAHGWMDGRRKKLDDTRTMQLLAPRKAPHWALSYKVRAARLIATNKMHPAGMAKIDQAIQDGHWHTMDSVDALEVPPDLQAAFAVNPQAKDQYETFPPSAQRDILRWIHLARTTKTRTKRIYETVFLAAQGKRASGTGAKRRKN